MSASMSSAKHHSPLPFLLLGIVLIVASLAATLLQIQTSEAFITNGSVVSIVPNWLVFLQPVDFVRGNVTANQAKAIMWGWGIELVFLICIVGYEVAHNAVSASNKALASWFRTGAFALILFDGYMDFSYGNLASGFWGQIAFAGITSFAVMFFWIIGFRFIEHGFAEWGK